MDVCISGIGGCTEARRKSKNEPQMNTDSHRLELGFAQKVDPIWNEPVITGNAGALARDEREARNSYIVKKVDTERAAHAVRARAPALPVLGCLFRPHHFLGKATLPRSLAHWASNIERGR